MKVRLARGAVVTVMVLALAVTPLSAVLSAGHFETWLPSWDMFGRTSLQVTMDDQTGLVRAMTPAQSGELDRVINPGGNRSVLAVTWMGGCSDRLATLSFRATDTGFVLTERTLGWGCSLLIGLDRSVAIYLWSPIDAETVTFSASG
jgi:hypothetical protein